MLKSLLLFIVLIFVFFIAIIGFVVFKAMTIVRNFKKGSKGKISHKQAVEKAENEYEKYKVIQDKNYVSDFDRLLSETKQIENK